MKYSLCNSSVCVIIIGFGEKLKSSLYSILVEIIPSLEEKEEDKDLLKLKVTIGRVT